MSIERMSRHLQAANASDYAHLIQCLRDAADRFDDVANTLDKNHPCHNPNYDPIGFLRASAERYRKEADDNSGGGLAASLILK